MADNPTQQLFDLWKKQIDEGTQAWSRLISQAPPAPGDPTAFWRPVLDQWMQTCARTFAQTPMTPDVIAQWKQLLDQSIEAWSRALAHQMNTEAFAQVLGRTLEQWLAAYGPLRKAADQSLDGALESLNLATRKQLTGVAKQIVELDERVERIEDAVLRMARRLEAMGQQEPRAATGAEASKEA